ncbi:MAG: ribonuclease J [Patescibacteria group bacterium]|nr:ribonuclease J [Patescibacteria group bacterium]
MENNKQPRQFSRGRPPFRRRPFDQNTRVLRNDSAAPAPAHAPASAASTPAPASAAPKAHRIVLGKGALKHPEAIRGQASLARPAMGSRPGFSRPGAARTSLSHVAGARMSVIRKENRPAKRGRPAPSLTRAPDDQVIPPLAADSIRVVPLGGVEEVGRNCTAIQFGDDIIVIDMGFQFRDENTPGIDYILPNTKYLEERRNQIRAVIITHGHLDHTGGIPYIMPRIGNPPIYTRLLTSVLIQKRQEEFPAMPKLDIRLVEKNQEIQIGKLKVKFFSVTHTIPDAMGVIIETPYGSIVHTGDLKMDHIDGIATPEEDAEYSRAFPALQGPNNAAGHPLPSPTNVLMLMADSTNVEIPGFSIPEKQVHKNLEEYIKNATGRLIIATFSSLLERLLKMIEFAEKYGKKVAVEGRSLKSNIEICKHLGLLKAKKETIITSDEIDNYPPDRIVILATGAQGDEFAALMRISNKTHTKIRITPRDTVILSSSVIPGNERAVQKLKDNLSRQGARIIHYRTAEVHSTGHAYRDETLWIHRKIHPKFFMPLHGYHYMLRVHADVAKEANGLREEDVALPDNSSIIEVQGGGTKLTKLKEKAPSSLMLVDGFSVGDVQDVVIRDRQMLAQDGIFIIFGIINASNGKLKKSPDIISRGFVYLRESQELLHEVRILIKDTVERSTRGQNPINIDFVKDNITDEVSKYLLNKTAKRPMVIPVILTI